jgi:hypothetical protein
LARKSQELGIKQDLTPQLLEEFLDWHHQQENAK